MAKLDLEYLSTILSYDQSLGEFRWNVDRARGAKKGGVAGTIGHQGYIAIGVDRRYYKAHRLAFLFAFGRWPNGVVDHINGVKSDNRLENLRDVTQAQNSRNQAAPKNNKSGFKGVHWHVRRNKWCASIRLNRKLIHLGYFDTPQEAATAYDEGSLKYHGSFGRQSALLTGTKHKVSA
jgi:hypothetical protein